MTANQTKKLMVKAKAMYHVGDLSLTIRRGEVVELSEHDAKKSNDLWRGQQFGLLEVKWVYAGAAVAVAKAKTVTVESKAQIQAHTQQLVSHTASGVHATQQDVQELREMIRDLRIDLSSVTQQAAKAKAELQAEIAKLEAKLVEMEKQPPKLFDLEEPKSKRGSKPKEPKEQDDAAGME